MSWKKSTIGNVLSVIKNGINCEQSKDKLGEKITRIETIAHKIFDFERVGYAKLTESEKERSRLKVGDILFSHINSPIHVGKTAIYEGEEDIYHGINLLLMRTIDDVDPYFFNYFLNHIFQTGYWKDNCKKSVNQASVNQKDIGKVNFSYPNLATQLKIVDKLDTVLAEIQNIALATEANINHIELLFQSCLREVYESGAEDWVEKKIEDVTVGTKNTSPEKFPDNFFKYVDVSSVSNETFQVENFQTLLGKDAPSRAKKHIAKSDVLFATVRPTLKRVAIVNEELDGEVASTGYVVLRANEQTHHKFIFYYLLSDLFMNNMEKLQKGASYPAVLDSDVKNQKIKIPSYENQVKVIEKLDVIFESLFVVKSLSSEKLNQIELLKKSLLRDAFNGNLIKD